ncbi:MAG: N-acetylmuramoyl-L-alanine amidase [Saprospiraceae bacterium]|nr:N-acetylmuramoyl-L-alanine amidase [Saprospiraceae bacterium]
MKATSIPQHEASFRQSGIDSSGTKFILTDETVNIGDSAGGKITFVDCAKQVPDTSYFFEEEYPKQRIVLHHTAGYLKGDIAQLSRQSYEVSVPFVIARSGLIYNLWKSKLWSYHLGPGAVGGNAEMSRSSIGIEISNIGFLRKKAGGILHTSYSTNDVYCSETETAFYQKLATPYRDERYYAKFTNAQYNSLVLLLRFLTKKYNIPRSFLPPVKRFDVFGSATEAANFKGICSHVNFRASGKWDIGPAFDWDRVSKKLKLGE